MKILGIETSCDETAAAIVTSEKEIIANKVFSQHESHSPYLGIVPEIAARNHLEKLDNVILSVLKEGKLGIKDIDAVAVTAGPGLMGGLLVGLMTAKIISLIADIPFIAVNHLEAHALTVRLTHNIDFPYLLVLLSGGHSEFIIVNDVGNYKKIGGTIDDAVGEAFDKTARILGLEYPGGPALEKMALKGNPEKYRLPRPLVGRDNIDLSLAGLKTAVWKLAENESPLNELIIADIAASFQQAIADILTNRTINALKMFHYKYPGRSKLVVAGGVASNKKIRNDLNVLCKKMNSSLFAPPIELCTDNAVMVAWTGYERLKRGKEDLLTVGARPRWPLEEINF